MTGPFLASVIVEPPFTKEVCERTNGDHPENQQEGIERLQDLPEPVQCDEQDKRQARKCGCLLQHAPTQRWSHDQQQAGKRKEQKQNRPEQ